MLLLQVLAIISVPILLFRLRKLLGWFKPIVMSYILGILIGNFFPDWFEHNLIHEITGLSIVIAIPLMLFPTDFSKLLRQPKTLLLAYLLAVVSTTVSVFVGYYIYQGSIDDIEVISGMIEGVYTGGTINLNAIAMAFYASEDLTILINGLDWALSGLYLLLIFTALPKMLRWILPFTSVDVQKNGIDVLDDDFFDLTVKDKVIQVSAGIGLATMILGIVVWVSVLLFGEVNDLLVVFAVTGLGLLLASREEIRNLKANVVLADYLMIIFGFTLGLQANISKITSNQNEIMWYFIFTYAFMLLVHLILSRVFRIDANSFLIGSSAAVFGAPFIGPIARTIKAQHLITPGIIVALLGNAMGTYLGIVITKLLMAL